MKKLLTIAFLTIFTTISFGWDFLLSDGTWTRQPSPFEIKENRVLRTSDNLEAQARFDDNNNLIVYTVYEGQEYICKDGTIPVPENAPHRVSILRLVLAIKNVGKLDEFMAWLEQSGYKEMFYIAQEFTTDNELFVVGKEMAKEALGMTDEEVEAIISSAYLNTK